PRLKVVYSKEPPLHPAPAGEENGDARRQTPGSISFVPSVAGLILAGEVVRDLTHLSEVNRP
ncbi:MAG: tRNA threonylcarbamoyladenosine dehydratase, partial [Schwartzia sp.]|nr:tRNA threonylcarbamoyladenosine dehydratase [Schwartzia sp. (in: firmicutes)]